MISFFDKLIVKSNPQAKEKILSLKSPLANSKPKVKKSMNSSEPSYGNIPDIYSANSGDFDGKKSNSSKRQGNHSYDNNGENSNGDDPNKPKKSNEFGKSEVVDNTEAIQQLLEKLNSFLESICTEFNKMILELPQEEQDPLKKQFEQYLNEMLQIIQDFNQIPNNTSIEEINKIYINKRDQIERYFREQVVSQINSYILKRSHKHAELRGDNPHLPYKDKDGKLKINKKPKKAQLLERNNALSLGGKTPTRKNPIIYNLKTPFGDVEIHIIGINFDNQVRLIIPKKYQDTATLYVNINRRLKEYATNYPDEMKYALSALESYLESPWRPRDTVENVLSNLNSSVSEITTEHATEEQRTMLAVLAGTLLLCESSQDRSNQGGKRERALIFDLEKMINLPENIFEHYVPADTAVFDKTYRHPPKTIQHGGNVRGKVQVGKLEPTIVKDPTLSEEILQSDKKRTGYLELSSDSEKDYDEDIDVFEIDTRRYRTTDNPGPNGGCLWRILTNHDVSVDHLQTAANNLGITYNDFVDIDDLGRLLDEINRLGNYNLTFHIDVFDYYGRYHGNTTTNRVGADIVYIALIYNPADGQGHYVEKLN